MGNFSEPRSRGPQRARLLRLLGWRSGGTVLTQTLQPCRHKPDDVAPRRRGASLSAAAADFIARPFGTPEQAAEKLETAGPSRPEGRSDKKNTWLSTAQLKLRPLKAARIRVFSGLFRRAPSRRATPKRKTRQLGRSCNIQRFAGAFQGVNQRFLWQLADYGFDNPSQSQRYVAG